MAIHSFQDYDEKILTRLTELARKNSFINPYLFKKYVVKRGLRDVDGRGVLVGLTRIGEVHSYIIDENEIIPVPGRLMYRGIDINDIVEGFLREERFGFEETCYLLLFGNLPNREELEGVQTAAGSPAENAGGICTRCNLENSQQEYDDSDGQECTGSLQL